MASTMTVADLARSTGIDPLEHLDRDATIPVHDEPQSQGDVRVRRLDTTPVRVRSGATWATVPPQGITVVDGGAGGHAHVLTPGLGAVTPVLWTTDVDDPLGLAVGVFKTAEPCFMYHTEHGGQGYAPGERVVRRQREQADEERLVED
jgi:hypothetical protein